jgi:hypothetical protein
MIVLKVNNFKISVGNYQYNDTHLHYLGQTAPTTDDISASLPNTSKISLVCYFLICIFELIIMKENVPVINVSHFT